MAKKQEFYEMVCKERLQEVSMQGYHLSDTDLNAVFQAQIAACKMNQVIDMDHHIIYDMAAIFVNSPYIQITTFVEVLKQALFCYYTIHSHVKKVADQDILDVVYQQYLLFHGEFSKECVLACIKKAREFHAY